MPDVVLVENVDVPPHLIEDALDALRRGCMSLVPGLPIEGRTPGAVLMPDRESLTSGTPPISFIAVLSAPTDEAQAVDAAISSLTGFGMHRSEAMRMRRVLAHAFDVHIDPPEDALTATASFWAATPWAAPVGRAQDRRLEDLKVVEAGDFVAQLPVAVRISMTRHDGIEAIGLSPISTLGSTSPDPVERLRLLADVARNPIGSARP
jgi:hypothetical protein